MAMFRPPTKQTHSVELESLLILCKDEAERNKLVAAIKKKIVDKKKGG